MSYLVDPSWYVDTGSTDQITADLDKMSIKEHSHGNDQVQATNGTGMDTIHVGHSHLKTPSQFLELNCILNVPQAARSLISVQKFAPDNGVFFEFHPNFFLVKHQNMKEALLKGISADGLYVLPSSLAP